MRLTASSAVAETGRAPLPLRALRETSASSKNFRRAWAKKASVTGVVSWSEQEQSEIDGMEGSRSAGAKMASVRMDKPGAFE